jgi:hypothetical protein
LANRLCFAQVLPNSRVIVGENETKFLPPSPERISSSVERQNHPTRRLTLSRRPFGQSAELRMNRIDSRGIVSRGGDRGVLVRS